MTAENLWDLIVVYFPILLYKRVSSTRYQQIVKLRSIWLLCTSTTLSLSDIDTLERLIKDFIKIQDLYVYRRNFDRLPACTSQMHALIHLSQQIRATGPPRSYWTFPVERICAGIVKKLKSRKHPYRNLTLELERSEKVSNFIFNYEINTENYDS